MQKKYAPRWLDLVERVIRDTDAGNSPTEIETNKRARGWLKTLVNGQSLTPARSANFAETLRVRYNMVIEASSTIQLSPNQLRRAREQYSDLLNGSVVTGDYVKREEYDSAIAALQAQIDQLRAMLAGVAQVSTTPSSESTPVNKWADRTSISLWTSGEWLYGNLDLKGTRYKLQFRTFDVEAANIRNNHVDTSWIDQAIASHSGDFAGSNAPHQASALYAEKDKYGNAAPVLPDAMVLIEFVDGEPALYLSLGSEFLPFTRATKGLADTFYKGTIK